MTAHAICMALAFVVAYLLMRPRLDRLGAPERHQLDLALLAVVLGLIGARARYVWERPELFFPPESPFAWSQVWSAANLNAGGMVWYGGALTAALGMVIYWRWRRHSLLAGADACVPAMLVGLAIGRVGCFLNGCCYGAACDLPWAVADAGGALRHPTQLYETLAAGALGGGLWWWTRRRRIDGVATLLGVVGYATWRFWVETLRDHGPLVERQVLGWSLTTSQITSLWLIAAAVAMAVVVAWRRARCRRADAVEKGAHG